MFKFIPNTGVPGFRVGLPDDDPLGFNVANDDSTPLVLPGAPDVPTVDDNYPFGATPRGFIAPPTPTPNPVAPLGNGLPLPLAANQMPTNPMTSAAWNIAGDRPVAGRSRGPAGWIDCSRPGLGDRKAYVAGRRLGHGGSCRARSRNDVSCNA
jgi:hypothetical protein